MANRKFSLFGELNRVHIAERNIFRNSISMSHSDRSDPDRLEEKLFIAPFINPERQSLPVNQINIAPVNRQSLRRLVPDRR